MKRKIAAVLMGDIAGQSADAPAAGHVRLDAGYAVIHGILARGGGRVIGRAGAAPIAEFQSAVDAVRAAVEVQATLRARNKATPPADQLDFRLGIAIAEVFDGDGGVPDETLDAVTRLVGLANPGGVCISRSVRDAVVSKLRLHMLDVTIEGARPDPEPPASQIKSATRTGVLARLQSSFATSPRLPWAAAALACGVAGIAVWLPARDTDQASPPAGAPKAITILQAADSDAKAGTGGTLKFMPAHAPDPSVVLTARRMLPQAWKECHQGSADKAVAGCKLLLDSGIAKGAELAEIHLANGKALRDRHELNKALEAFAASIALAPTAPAFSLRGTVHYDNSDWDKAIADYSEAIRLDPANGEVFNNRAWTYYRAGRYPEALADADVAVRILAKEAYAWDTRAHIHAKLGNRAAAVSDFRAALAIDPSNATSKDGLTTLGAN